MFFFATIGLGFNDFGYRIFALLVSVWFQAWIRRIGMAMAMVKRSRRQCPLRSA